MDDPMGTFLTDPTLYPLAGFLAPVGAATAETPVFSCPDCGGAVLDKTKHYIQHRTLNSTLDAIRSTIQDLINRRLGLPR
jgi:hypothetical protein